MNKASNFAYLRRKKAAPVLERHFDGAPQNILPGQPEQPDTNVISVRFNTLRSAEDNLQMGDAIFCKDCRSCVSSLSQLYSKADYQEKFMKEENKPKPEEKEEDKEEQKSNEKAPKAGEAITTVITDTDKVWVCEFCGVHNVLNNLDLEEIPKTDDVIYLIKSAESIHKNPTDLASDVTNIFCIDNSGSMSVTTEVKGKHDIKHGLSAEEYEMLKQFIEYGADQHLPNQKKDTTFVTRKQCVLAAIESQLLEMKSEFPNRRVGLVTFDNEVNIVGDGKQVPETVAGDKLYKYDILQQIGLDNGQKLISTTVKDSAETLIKKFEQLKESGKTALGPALLISIGLATKGKQGSKVIICTDGLANIGLGEMDTPEGLAKADEFFTSLANLAKENGISVSVISIKGEGCKLDVIGKLADLTSGSLMRVDPEQITSEFANVMREEVVGTQVEVKVKLHQGLKFRNEQEEHLKERGSLFQKTVGNVTAKTELTFEYELRPDEELMEFGVDPDNLKSVPFQAQIIYNSTNGDRLMRVISMKLDTTHNLQEAEKNVMNVNVLATRALQQQAHFAHGGLYHQSEEVGQSWDLYLDKNIAQNVNARDGEVLNKYKNKNYSLQSASSNRRTKIESRSRESESKKSASEQGILGKVMGFFSKDSKAEEPKPSANMRSYQPQMQVLGGGMNYQAPGKISVVAEKKEEEAEEDDCEYALFHDAKNCNSDF